MQQVYLSRRRTEDTLPAQEPLQTAVPGPSLQELAAGAAPSREQMGRRVDLPEAIRAKMEASFGANFSNVRLYESQTVADAGADALPRAFCSIVSFRRLGQGVGLALTQTLTQTAFHQKG